MQTYASTKSNTGNNKLLFRDHLAILLCSSLSSLFLLKTQRLFQNWPGSTQCRCRYTARLNRQCQTHFHFLSKLKFLNIFFRWFRTGDIGQIDTQDAVLKIIDRKKDLVKLQMGEYVSLGKVEACLKIHPLIDNICVIADSSKTYCVALVVPDMARLTELAIQLELCLGYKELCENPLVIESITGQLQSHAKETLQKFEIPQKFALISNPWTPDTGLVTSSMKLKRKAIQARYFDIIHQLYQNSPSKSKTN